MNWKHLILEVTLDPIVKASFQRPQLIFKHSTRCSISTMARSRLEREWNLDVVDPWYLDMITYRSISNMIESRFKIQHESPQAILIVNCIVIYHASHNGISVDQMAKALP